MTETLSHLLLQLSEAEPPALLWGRVARRYQGAEFDRLLDANILIEERPATEWPVCDSCECELDMRPLTTIRDKQVAICPLDRSNDEILDQDDLRIFRIDHARLIHEIVRVSGFENMPTEISPGLWSLGMISGMELFLTFHGRVARSAATIDAMKLTAQGRRQVLISPRLAAAERLALDRANVQAVELTECLRSTPGRTIPTLALDLPTATRSEPRLLIHVQDQSITLDGKAQKLTPRSFKLIHFMAREAVAGQPLCERRRIEQHLWSTIVSERAVADAVRDLRKKIRPILPKDMTPEHFIENRPPANYLIALSADQIRIDD